MHPLILSSRFQLIQGYSRILSQGNQTVGQEFLFTAPIETVKIGGTFFTSRANTLYISRVVRVVVVVVVVVGMR